MLWKIQHSIQWCRSIISVPKALLRYANSQFIRLFNSGLFFYRLIHIFESSNLSIFCLTEKKSLWILENHKNCISSKSDSQSAEGNIKCIGQFKSGASPPDDKPEYGYGQRVVQIRRFIHEQTRSRQPNRLLDWWQLVKGGFQKLKFRLD